MSEDSINPHALLKSSDFKRTFLLVPFIANELWNNEVWVCMGRLPINIAERETETQLVRNVPLRSLRSPTCGEGELELELIPASSQQEIRSWATIT